MFGTRRLVQSRKPQYFRGLTSQLTKIPIKTEVTDDESHDSGIEPLNMVSSPHEPLHSIRGPHFLCETSFAAPMLRGTDYTIIESARLLI